MTRRRVTRFVPVSQTVKAFLPRMKAQNHGHIVTVASVLGLFSTACVEVNQQEEKHLRDKI